MTLPLEWDPRLDALGVKLVRAQPAEGEACFRLVKARWLNEAESQGQHHIFVDVLDEEGRGSERDIIAALERSANPDGDPLTDDHLDVVNLSLGGPGRVDSPMSIALSNAVEAGIVAVASAGNSGLSGYDSVTVPGIAERALTVGMSFYLFGSEGMLFDWEATTKA